MYCVIITICTRNSVPLYNYTISTIFKIIDLRIQSSSQESYDKELQKQIDTYTAIIEEKENVLETPFTPEVIEEYANEHLGLYDPNVVIFANDQ